jgi:hypothetical protein
MRMLNSTLAGLRNLCRQSDILAIEENRNIINLTFIFRIVFLQNHAWLCFSYTHYSPIVLFQVSNKFVTKSVPYRFVLSLRTDIAAASGLWNILYFTIMNVKRL